MTVIRAITSWTYPPYRSIVWWLITPVVSALLLHAFHLPSSSLPFMPLSVAYIDSFGWFYWGVIKRLYSTVHLHHCSLMINLFVWNISHCLMVSGFRHCLQCTLRVCLYSPVFGVMAVYCEYCMGSDRHFADQPVSVSVLPTLLAVLPAHQNCQLSHG